MLKIINDSIVAILSTLIVVLLVTLGISLFFNYAQSKEINNLNVQLGVVAAGSQIQEVKIVEAKHIEEKIKVVTQDKIKVVKEYVYDHNKTDCENAAIVLSGTF